MKKALLFCLIGLLSVGCSSRTDTLPRVAVKGKVTKGGAPVEAGMLNFTPIQEAPGVSAGISMGEFSIPIEKGPIPGQYKVTLEVIKIGGGSGGNVAAPKGGGGKFAKAEAPKDVKPGESIESNPELQIEIQAGKEKSAVLDLNFK